MKWQYKLSFFLLLLSQTSFFILAALHTDFYPNNDAMGAQSIVGYSWILYHFEHWVISFGLAFGALLALLYGFLLEIMDSRRTEKKNFESKQAVPSSRKWGYILLVIIIWIIVIILSLLFSGQIN